MYSTSIIGKATAGCNVNFQLITHANKVSIKHASNIHFTRSPPWFEYT